MHVKTLEALAAAGELKGKRVLIRSDLNAPHDAQGRITNEARLVAKSAFCIMSGYLYNATLLHYCYNKKQFFVKRAINADDGLE